MPVSSDYVICPYCKTKLTKSVALNTSGLIIVNGHEREIHCTKCDSDFNCEVIVSLKFKTTKEMRNSNV